MTLDLLLFSFGFVILGIIIVLFDFHKRTNRNFDNLKSDLSNSQKASQLSVNQLRTSLSEKITESTNLHISSEKLFMESQKEIEKSLAQHKSTLEAQSDFIDSVQSKLTSDQKGLEIDLRDYAKMLADQTSTDLSQKISALVIVVNQLVADNKDLRKRIEFFTEIDSDSKKLNITEEESERELLIQKAIGELPRDQSSTQVRDSRPVNRDPLNQINTPGATIDENEPDLPAETEKTANNNKSADLNILDEEQKKAFIMMEYSKQNLFITGKAGTGKSFLLEIFSRVSEKKVIKLAPTGRAAINISGATLHSTFGFYNLEKLNVDDIVKSTIKLRSEKARVLQEVDVIVIDEVSMVRADIFDKIDRILRALNSSEDVFGGKQIILFGDPFQLPPVAKKLERDYLIDRYGGIYFFRSNAYNSGMFNFVELSTNHRQKDDLHYYEILNRIRNGKTNSADVDTLNSKFVKNRDALRRIVTLFPTKAEADKVNRDELKKVEAKEYLYKAEIVMNKKNDQTPLLENIFPITDELKLKRGALVMFVANDIARKWVNGTLGIVSSLKEDQIIVSVDGRQLEVDSYKFSEKEITYTGGRLEYEDVLVIKQYPLILAYAITIHKSQGMTYKNVACDIEACFDTGQAYVALSRCSSLEGLFLLNPISSSIAKVDNDVRDFYLKQFNAINT